MALPWVAYDIKSYFDPQSTAPSNATINQSLNDKRIANLIREIYKQAYN